MSYTLRYPGVVRFGAGAAKELPEHIPNEGAVLLVTGRSALSNGLAESLKSLLASWKIIDASGMSRPEPTLECVDAIVGTARAGNATAVVAVGGGSCIDAAKAAAAIAPRGTAKTAEFFDGERSIERDGLFLAALPTTAGTGAEITSNAVLTDPARRMKKSIRSPFMVPDIAIIDPELTLGTPSSVVAASGMDAFTQALESYTSASANAATRALAKTAVAKIYANIADAVENGADMIAKTELAEGSMLSAMAFSQSGLGAVHGLAHPIGSLLELPHGFVCAVLLPKIMEWNKVICAAEYAEVAAASDIPGGAEGLVAAVTDLNRKLGIPNEFASSGLTEEHFQFIIDNCRSRSMSGNPRPMTDDDVRSTLMSLSTYQ